MKKKPYLLTVLVLILFSCNEDMQESDLSISDVQLEEKKMMFEEIANSYGSNTLSGCFETFRKELNSKSESMYAMKNLSDCLAEIDKNVFGGGDSSLQLEKDITNEFIEFMRIRNWEEFIKAAGINETLPRDTQEELFDVFYKHALFVAMMCSNNSDYGEEAYTKMLVMANELGLHSTFYIQGKGGVFHPTMSNYLLRNVAYRGDIYYYIRKPLTYKGD